MKKMLHEKYIPQYFLAALGYGGVAVSFFMYLMFMTEHKTTPIPTFESLMAAWSAGSVWMQGMMFVALSGIIIFSILHIFFLVWNLREYAHYRTSTAYENLRKTNGEVGLMIPYLTLAMTVNVFFILGAVFVPGLWGGVEMLFPLALMAFGVLGFLALSTFGRFMGRILAHSFDFEKNNNFNQLTSAMTFSMVAVGFAASAAMSHEKATVAVALIGSIFFGVISMLLVVFFGILGMKSILRQGINEDTAASLWIFVPILTLLGITMTRDIHGISTLMGEKMISYMPHFLITTTILSIQIFFLFVGYQAMNRIKYIENYILGDRRTANVFAIICPGVALVVFGFFFLHLGLVRNGIVDKFSLAYFLLLAPLIIAQAKTIIALVIVTKKNIWE